MPLPDGTRGGHDFIEGDIDNPTVIPILDRRLRQRFSLEQMDEFYLPECNEELWKWRQIAYDSFPAWAPMSTSQCIAKIDGKSCFTNLAPQLKICPVCGSPIPISPQRMAFESDADISFNGGSAGGGKSGLLIGVALMLAQRALFLRKHADHLLPLIKSELAMFTNKVKYRSIGNKHWEFPDENLVLAWCGLSTDQDRKAVQGNQRDHLLVDECAQLTRADVFYAMNWNRSDAVGVNCRTVMGSNPPMERQGIWVYREFYPWLRKDDQRVPSGKKLYFMPVIGSDTNEMRQCEPDEVEYEVMPNGKRVENRPISKTFVSMNISDNYFYGPEYMKKLNAQDPVMRDKLKYGIWTQNFANQDGQAIPTDWVYLAQKRWQSIQWPDYKQDTIGVDVGREEGGDLSVISSRYGNWFSRLVEIPGVKNVTDGPWLAQRILSERFNTECPVYIDGASVGTSPFDQLGKTIGKDGLDLPGGGNGRAINVNAKYNPWCVETETGMFYATARTMLWMRMKNLLNPANMNAVALPPSDELLSELTTPLVFRRGNMYLVEAKEDVKKRIQGSSTDRADAVLLSAIGLSCPHKPIIAPFLKENRFDTKGVLVDNGRNDSKPKETKPRRPINMIRQRPSPGSWMSA